MASIVPGAAPAGPSYLAFNLGRPSFYFGTPIENRWSEKDRPVIRAAIPYTRLNYSGYENLKANGPLENIALVAKRNLSTLATFQSGFSTFCSPFRHLAQVLPAVALGLSSPDLFNKTLKILDHVVIASDGIEIVGQTNDIINGEIQKEIEHRDWSMLAAQANLFVGNIIGLGFFLQKLELVTFKAAVITSDLIPSRIMCMCNWIANHEAAGRVVGFLPEKMKAVAVKHTGIIFNHTGRILAMPVANFFGGVAGLSFASFYFFATINSYKKGNDARLATYQNAAKFLFAAAVGVVGIENTYTKAALGGFALATVGYKAYRTKYPQV